MKKVYIIISLILIASTLIYVGNIYFYENKPVTSIDPVLMPVKKALLELQQEKDFNQLSREEQLEKVYAVLEKTPESHQRLRHQYQVAMGQLPDIVFYGRVIDQNNQPVVGASIWHSGENAYLSSGDGKGLAQTDEEGYFMLDTSGAALALGSIKHPEIDGVVYYRLNKPDSPKARYSTTVRFLSHSKSDRALSYNDYSVKDKAYVIQVWRLDKYEGTIAGYSSLHITSDSKVHSLMFDSGRNTIKLTDDKNKAQFNISCTRPHMVNNQDYGDWSLKLTPVNGVIVEANDPYLNHAPEFGYQTSIQVNMSKEAENYSHQLKNKRYYFAVNNSNKYYGSLNAHYEPFYGPDKEVCIVRFNHKINPTGSRNLELKRGNTSQPKLVSPQKLASN